MLTSCSRPCCLLPVNVLTGSHRTEANSIRRRGCIQFTFDLLGCVPYSTVVICIFIFVFRKLFVARELSVECTIEKVLLPPFIRLFLPNQNLHFKGRLETLSVIKNKQSAQAAAPTILKGSGSRGCVTLILENLDLCSRAADPDHTESGADIFKEGQHFRTNVVSSI